jgi:hypothetical protein
MAGSMDRSAFLTANDISRLPVSSRLGQTTLECGGKRSATPLWLGQRLAFPGVRGDPKRRRRFALPAHSNPDLSGRQPPCMSTQE